MQSPSVKSTSRWPDLLVLLVLGCGILLSVLAWNMTGNLVADRMENDFLLRSTNLRQTLQRELSNTAALLKTHAPLLVHQDTLTRADFNRVASHILANQPELKALEWVPKVSHSQRTRFESIARAEGFHDFFFADRDANNQRTPVGTRETYYPILYIQPLEGNEDALGLATGPPMRSVTIRKAILSGDAAASTLVSLVQDPRPNSGILIFQPIYRGFDIPADSTLREELLIGLLEGVFQLDDLMASALQGTALGGLEVAMYNSSQDFRLTEDSEVRRRSIRTQMLDCDVDLDAQCWQSLVRLAGQDFVLVIRPSDEFFSSYPHSIKWGMLVVGLLFTMMTALYLRALQQRNRAIGKQVMQQSTDLQSVSAELHQSLADHEALRVETLMLAESVRSSREGICVSNADDTIRYVNPAFEKLFGVTMEELQGKPETSVLPDREVLRERGDLQGEGWPLSGEVMLRRGFGKPILAAVTCNQVTLDNDRVHTITIVRDVSERRALEKQLANSQKMEALGQLAGGVAHDFNNILTAIHGSCQLLLLKLDDSPVRSVVTDIMRTGERAATLVSQLLEFGRPREQRKELLNLNEVAGDLCHMLERLIPSSISLEFKSEPELPCILADRTQIEQVLMNLVLNARDAIKEVGRIRITTSTIHYSSDNALPQGMSEGDLVRLSVSDNGSGIPPEIQEKIFEPFFTTKKEKGNGLGLATVYNVVRVGCKGTISLDSRPGIGTEFMVDFPVAAGTRGTKDSQKAEPAHESQSILVVEDEKEVRELVNQVLLNAGYQTNMADSAEMALTILNDARQRFDLIVTDIVMPGMNGMELGKQVNILHPGMKILYMSAYTNESFSEEKIISRDEFLQKPFLPSVLTGRVHRLLDSGIQPPLS